MSNHGPSGTTTTTNQSARGNPPVGWRSIWHYRRSSAAVIASVAVATAVLTGALLVGASMRQSLRDLTLGRLGVIDSLVVGKGFFRAALAPGMESAPGFQDRFSNAVPAIMIRSASSEVPDDDAVAQSRPLAGNISVWGIDGRFEKMFADPASDFPVPEADEAVLSAPLGEELGISPASVDAGTAFVTVRFARPSRLPGDSALGRKDDLTISLVRLKVKAIADDAKLGGLSLAASQAGSRNVFVSLQQLQTELNEPAVSSATGPDFCNLILLGGKDQRAGASETDLAELRKALPVELPDLGIECREIRLQSGTGESAQTVAAYTSLSTSQLVFPGEEAAKLQSTFPSARPVSTYLANAIQREADSGNVAPTNSPTIPYSMISGIEIGSGFQPDSTSGGKLKTPGAGEVVLNAWAAEDLNAGIGDRISIRFFEPESTHGQSLEKSATLKVVDIAALVEPAQPFSLRGRDEVVSAVFDSPPSLANDPDLTPAVPGLTDSASIENWDVPFEMKERIRPEDDDYWSLYRTTPKAFVSLETAASLWSSRFGTVTGFRIPDQVEREEVEQSILSLWKQNELSGGLSLVPLRHLNLKASSGSTPFDALFLGLSLFIIAAALLMVSLLFRLGLDDRIRQVGLFTALGFSSRQISRIWLGESVWLASAGACLGSLLGIGWAALMIWGLTTWWVAAIGRPFLRLYLDPLALTLGGILGLLAALVTVAWAVRQASRRAPTELLAGVTENEAARKGSRGRWRLWTVAILLLAAVGVSLAGTRASGDNQAAAFLGGGFLVLTALLMAVRLLMDDFRNRRISATGSPTLLALSNLWRNPGRSSLTVGLIAIATFLVTAINAFRLAPSDQSTGGVEFVATTAQPLFHDLDTEQGQQQLLGDERLPVARVYSFRVQPGEDASCNNVYQSSRPQVLGVPAAWIQRFDDPSTPQMRWAAAAVSSANPWNLLAGHQGVDLTATGEKDAAGRPIIDAVIDKNTAWYSLKIYTVGSLFPVQFETGEAVTFRVAGLLENSLLQGSLLISEDDFERAFPSVSGYRFFLIAPGSGASGANAEGDRPLRLAGEVATLEQRLSDAGFDAQPARVLLERFMSVQNTYLSAFQSLGGLGLLLGTAGLAAVMFRNIVRRRGELALLQAVGFRPKRLSGLVVREQVWLLATGLMVGFAAALGSVFPHWLAGGASWPWSGILLIIAGTAVSGLLTAWLVARQVLAQPVIPGLRNG